MPPKPKVQPRRQPARGSAKALTEDGSQDTPPQDGATGDVEMVGARAGESELLTSESTAFEPVSEPVSRQIPQPAPTIAQPNKRPVQRLASLNPRTAGSGASGSRAAGLKFQPKSFIRRSKEEREAQEKVEEQRRRAKIAAQGTSRSSAQRGGPNGRVSARGGGMTRLNQNRYSGGQASGALGGSTIGGDSTKKRPGFGGLFGRGSSGEGSSRVKREIDGDVVMGGRPKTKKKGPGCGYAPDDDFDEAEGPRVNIEHINLISDEESQEEQPEEPTQHGNKRPGRDAKVQVSGLKPVRIDRHEHVERSVGVNTEASSITLADVRRKAKERALAEGGLFLSDEEAKCGKSSKSKSKGKAKDVQFVKDERKWQGVYPEDEDIYTIPKIKEEPTDNTGPMVIDSALPAENLAPTTPEILPQPTSPKASRKANLPPTGRRVKVRRTSRGKTQRPVLQTAEDRQEWARYQEDLYILSEELGALSTTKSPATIEDSTNMEGDGAKADAEAKIEPKKDRKQGLVYLFQLPPIIPSLITPAEKEESEAAAAKKPSPPPEKPEKKSSSSSALMPPRSNPFSTTHKTEPLIKPDPDSKSNLVSTSRNNISLGKAGKLIVYGSGNVTATWGGVEM